MIYMKYDIYEIWYYCSGIPYGKSLNVYHIHFAKTIARSVKLSPPTIQLEVNEIKQLLLFSHTTKGYALIVPDEWIAWGADSI